MEYNKVIYLGSLLDMFENTPTFILRLVCTKWKYLVDNHPSLKSISKSFKRKKILELARDLEEAELYHGKKMLPLFNGNRLI